MEANSNLETFFFILNIIGVIAFSSAGFIVAKKNKLDILGIYTISIMSSSAGGIIKDIILNKTPEVFVSTSTILTSIITATILIFLHKRIKNYEKKKIFLLLDAIGLCAFSAIGTLDGINYGLNIFGILFLGTITAVGGGIMRDIMMNDIPVILKENFYASIALIVSFLIYILSNFDRLFYVEIIFVIAIGIGLRVLVIYKKISLPKIS